MPLVGELAGRWGKRPLRSAPAEQVRRACGVLDGFAADLRDLVGVVPIAELTELVANAETWSERLWTSQSEAAAIYNEVRHALAALQRYRTKELLGQPSEHPDTHPES